MKICDDLRQAVLQAAIQGKLTSQRPEDGDARELLKQIAAEKEQLIKEKKIKKGKATRPIDLDDLPFDIPENWEWFRLGEIAFKLTDGAHLTPKYVSSGIPFLSVKDISTGVIDFSNTKYITEEEHKELYSRCDPEKGDLLITKVGTTGIPVIVDTDKQFSLFVSVALLKSDWQKINVNFLRLLINSPLVQMQAKENTKGVGNKNWVLDAIANTLCVLPPLLEQQHIVAKVEKLMAEIDELEKVEKELHALKTAFPGDMKAALLQAAMQGKLTTQRKEDGDARDLLKQIAKEKARLIKEKKIKKEKPLPEIAEEEIPFEVPDNWVWCRLGSLLELNPKNISEDDDEAGFVPMALLDAGYGSNHFFETRKWGKIKKGFTHFADGDLVLAKITPCFQNRKSAIISNLPNGIGAGTTELHVLRDLTGLLDMKFFLFVCKSTYFIDNGLEAFTGTAGQQRIGSDFVSNFLIPLPPLAEQHRIVAKLEKLLPLCDGLVEE